MGRITRKHSISLISAAALIVAVALVWVMAPNALADTSTSSSDESLGLTDVFANEVLNANADPTTDEDTLGVDPASDDQTDGLDPQQDITDPSTGITYQILDDTATYGAGAYVTGYSGTSTDLTIPAQLGGADVVSVLLYRESLTSIDVSACTALKSFRCEYNSITSLDLSNNTNLEMLGCSSNQISSLNVSKNTSLTKLLCTSNNLTSLDVSKNTALKTLYCSNNKISSLDVTANTSLIYLQCYNNKLSTLNVSKNTALVSLYCDTNNLSQLDVSKNVALDELSFRRNNFTSIDVSKNTNLTALECSENNLTSLDISNNTKLERLDCSNNQISSLDVSSCPNLDNFYCSYNKLSSLDVSSNTELERFGCYGNQLTSLILGTNDSLYLLNCNMNQLTTVDTSGCPALDHFSCNTNQITSLDLSSNTSLTRLQCANNKLASLDLSANPKIEILVCASNKIGALDVSNIASLEILYCSDNLIPSLNVSNNADLETLLCNGNRLTSLDISANTKLTGLLCQLNSISDTSALETWVDANCGQVLPQNPQKLVRLSGSDRYKTMDKIIRTVGTPNSGINAILATGGNFPDALAASGLAGVYDAPVILIDGTLSSPEGTEALTELKRLGVTYVYIVGGESAVSSGISEGLSTDGFSVTRIAGGNRVETSLAIYEQGVKAGSLFSSGRAWGNTVIVATSAGFADALSVSPLSSSASLPIILTDASGNLTDEAKEAIANGGFDHAVIVGGNAAVSADTESWLDDMFWEDDVVRLAGGNRYETSVAVADFSSGQGDYAAYPDTFGYTALKYTEPSIATGTNFPDALAGTALYKMYGGVLLLASDSNTTALDRLAENKSTVECGYVLGGTSAISDSLYSRLEAALD